MVAKSCIILLEVTLPGPHVPVQAPSEIPPLESAPQQPVKDLPQQTSASQQPQEEPQTAKGKRLVLASSKSKAVKKQVWSITYLLRFFFCTAGKSMTSHHLTRSAKFSSTHGHWDEFLLHRLAFFQVYLAQKLDCESPYFCDGFFLFWWYVA